MVTFIFFSEIEPSITIENGGGDKADPNQNDPEQKDKNKEEKDKENDKYFR